MSGLSQETVQKVLQDFTKTRLVEARVGDILGIRGNIVQRVKDQLSGNFDENLLKDQSEKKVSKAERCANMLKYQGWKLNKLLSRESKLLDVGSGNGEFADALSSKLGIEYTCLEKENSGYPVSVPKKGNLVLYGGSKFPFGNNTFSILTAMQLMHHIVDKLSFMEELFRVCVPYGYLIIQDHNTTTMDDYIVLETVHTYYAVQENHVGCSEREILGRYMSAVHMIELAKEVGFRFVYSTHNNQHRHPGKHYYALFQKM